jgi:DNA-binding NarL/FixJ family response regulator
MAIKVVLVIGDARALENLQGVLSGAPDIDVVAQSLNGEAGLECAWKYNPDVLIIELTDALMDAFWVAQQLRDKHYRTKVVLLGTEVTDHQMLEAVRSGVCGVLLAHLAPKLIAPCIRKVAMGGHWLEFEASARLINRLIEQQERPRARWDSGKTIPGDTMASRSGTPLSQTRPHSADHGTLPLKRVRRTMKDVDGVTWTVTKIREKGRDCGSLKFVGAGMVIKARECPANWRDLSDAALERIRAIAVDALRTSPESPRTPSRQRLHPG